MENFHTRAHTATDLVTINYFGIPGRTIILPRPDNRRRAFGTLCIYTQERQAHIIHIYAGPCFLPAASLRMLNSSSGPGVPGRTLSVMTFLNTDGTTITHSGRTCNAACMLRSSRGSADNSLENPASPGIPSTPPFPQPASCKGSRKQPIVPVCVLTHTDWEFPFQRTHRGTGRKK
ncbi:putative endonuclease [Anopheles sinensis]|uniref:Putative endonuclease n=1 Tax=Anopheles sinensis TaxID=74873 RepID=A0A084WP24_ANOSI|nr:putative endonuclease [Anopheles sinensis]